MSKQGKILVIRGGAIGDFILTLPALTALRNQFPQVHLEVLGYPHIAQLALIGGLADQVRSIEARAMAGFFAARGNLSEDLADYFSEFDLIVSYLYDPDGIFQGNVARCSPAQYIPGPHRPDESENLHAAEVFLRPLERLAIFDAETHPRLPLDASGNGIALPPGRWLALHPGSGSERKNWPETNWRQLLARLLETTELNLLLVGGEAEGDRLARLTVGLPSERVLIRQNLALPDLAHWLSRCEKFLGHDSGISHLAAAVGLPGLVLWGNTNETVWRPRSDRIRLLHPPSGLHQLTVEEVMIELA